MFQDISIEELLTLKDHGDITVIDVRSPSEFMNSTIPGSINIPFFNDEEREEIGTIYKQVGVQEAKDRGLELMSTKLPNFVKEFSNIKGKKAVFCWRGGMRSRTTATILDLMGIKVFRLEGGYRNYRQWVVHQLENFELDKEVFVLNGNTGTGKTTILRRLKKEGFPVIDLEGLANHRGSIFGQIGLQPNNQKTFDSFLMEDLQRYQSSPFILFEGESSRIGKVTLPPFLMKKKEQGLQFVLELPMEERVKHILEDYEPWNHKQECLEAFKRIKKRLHTPIAKQIELELEAENFSTAVGLLLEYYYDPLYEYSTNKYPEDKLINIKADNVDETITVIKDYLGIRKK